MKTEDLYLEYARVIKMCEGTKVKPWKCIKGKGNFYSNFNDHPIFKSPPDKYEFAIAILEDKPVFVGDVLFHTLSGCPVTVNHAVLFSQLSWTKPEPKRTFTLNGVELPCPITKPIARIPGLSLGTEVFFFNSESERNTVANSINELLLNARDKS